ncbi:hypothetical protein Bca4012_083697 [Brassica carinata]
MDYDGCYLIDFSASGGDLVMIMAKLLMAITGASELRLRHGRRLWLHFVEKMVSDIDTINELRDRVKIIFKSGEKVDSTEAFHGWRLRLRFVERNTMIVSEF